MSFTSWLRTLRSFGHLESTARKSRRAALSGPAKRFQPKLEAFEDRCLPSTFTVLNLLDSGPDSLRAAVVAANANPGADSIDFAVTGTISLESALPALNSSLAIQGPGANQLTVARNAASTTAFDVFTVGSGATVQISGLTLTGANNSAIVNAGTLTVSNSTLSGNSGSQGGAIENTGTLTVSNSTLSGNRAWGGYGGAIDNSGSVDIRNSTLSGNAALGTSGDPVPNPPNIFTDGTGGQPAPPVLNPTPAAGGAIFGGVVTISNSTIANNSAVGGTASAYWYTDYSPDSPDPINNSYRDVYLTAGAPAYGGGLDVAQLSVDHCTIAGNQATGGNDDYYPPAGYGAGIYSNGTTQVYDTILAGNSAAAGPDLYGSITSLGHNLIGYSFGGSGYAASDLLNVNPQLGPLQNNGGPTQTMALLAGSPAMDAGDNTNAPAYDQRGPGFARIKVGAIDIGAFEVQNQFDRLVVSGFPSAVTAGAAGSFTITAKKADGSTNTGYTGTVHFTSSDPQAVLPANYTFTAADNGTHTFSVGLKTAGIESITVANLHRVGYAGWTGLYEKPTSAGTEEFKATTRAAIERRGYEIVANVGDQQSDLDGGHADRDFKLPDPFYFISD